MDQVSQDWTAYLILLILGATRLRLLGGGEQSPSAPCSVQLRFAVLVHSFALVAMSALAAGIDRWVVLGGMTFLISDLMLGLRIADLDFRNNRLVVMVTYMASQYMITTGWARRVRPGVAFPI